MLKHYIKFTLRNFRSNKVIFAGSLATLCLGALCISLLFFYVNNELTMDDFHTREKDIFMVETKSSPKSKWKPSGGHFNIDDYSGIDKKIYLKKYRNGELKFKYNEKVLTPQGYVTDSSFLKIFDFKLKRGDRLSALDNPNQILITESLAKKIFGSEDVIDKTIIISWRYEEVFTVKGVLENPPSNSSMDFDFIIRSNKNKFSRMGVDFILANENFNKNEFINEINKKQYIPKNRMFNLVSLDENYFNPSNTIGKYSIFSRSGNKENLEILMAIILVIVVITILNFTNLQIIVSNSGIKSISINKIHGANKISLIKLKAVEALILIFSALLLITFLCNLLLSQFNTLVNLSLSPSIWEVILLNVSILTITVFVGFLYPLTITTFRISIIKSIKGGAFLENQFFGRKLILVVQCVLTFVLIISAITVNKQLYLLLNKDLGFKTNNIIITKLFHPIPAFSMSSSEARIEKAKEQQSAFQFLINELNTHTFIVYHSQGVSPLGIYKMPWKNSTDLEYSTHNILTVTPNYEKVLDIPIIEGRFFDVSMDKDRAHKVVINEAAKKLWNITDIANDQLFNKSWGGDKKDYEIIGVIKDFNYEHLSVSPQPLMIHYFKNIEDDFLIQFQENRVQGGLKFVEELFNKVNPNETFQYSFLSDEIEALYKKEKRLSIVYILFAIIALLISAIGLFTIALYDTQRRVKEIGIRKVNGATIKEIMIMLNKDFIKWVFIAFVIACPIAYYAMSKWLENFAYKTGLSWWVFALAGVFTFVVALLTVSWQTHRAATRNPVESLRDE